ncbi:tyrosine--tRNA ligase [Candidatus Pacearchaeota archaeon]|nr:tyrosine--tRNA ligase [Candidatus Pacearchaeota archaeon]
MAKGLSVDERMALITRNTAEVIDEEELKALLNEKKEPVVYWGTMTTGSPSIAYLFPMLKIADFLRAGCKVKILLADLHAALDGSPWDLLEKRSAYYKEVLTSMLKAIGTDVKRLEFVKGSSFQLDKQFFNDVLKLSTISSVRDSTKAASEAVKTAQGDSVKLSGLVYPLMQALDEEYLGVDIQLAGVDQRKILVYAREYLPQIGYKARVEVMNPMIRGLVGEQMRSSVEGSKIDVLDDQKMVEKRVNGADFVEGDSDNGVMALLKYVVFVLKDELVVKRPEKFGGDVSYASYGELEAEVVSKKMHPLDVKVALARELNVLLDVVRTEKAKKLKKLAYP